MKFLQKQNQDNNGKEIEQSHDFAIQQGHIQAKLIYNDVKLTAVATSPVCSENKQVQVVLMAAAEVEERRDEFMSPKLTRLEMHVCALNGARWCC